MKINDLIDHVTHPAHSPLYAAGVGIALIFAFTAGGFGERSEIVEQCESSVSKSVRANYSELETGIDFDGEVYTSWNTWSEPASDVFTVKTLDGKVHSTSHRFELHDRGGYFAPPMPEHDTRMKGGRHFSRFSKGTSSNLKVRTFDGEKQRSFDTDVKGSNRCVEFIGRPITVSTWWGISYDTDWDDA